MHKILDDKFFNLFIDEVVENKLIEAANTLKTSLIKVQTAQDIQSLICHGLLDGVGFFEFERDLLKNSYKILIQNTDYPPDLIFPSICLYLYKHMPIILSVQWYQNHHSVQYCLTCKKDPKNSILSTVYVFQKKYPVEIILEKRASLKECENQVKKDLDGLLCFAVDETLAESKEIESDLRYSPGERINAIKNTRTKLLSINSYINNDDLEQLIDQLPTEGQQVNTLLKLIRKAKCNYLCCDGEGGLVYIDIINIVYGVYNIRKKLFDHEDMIKHLLHMPKSRISLLNIKIQNLQNDLLSFKEKVNIDQILQYVSVYYHYNMLRDDTVDFDTDFKNLIAKIFDRTPSKLFENELDISNINRPFQFLYYPRFEWSTTYERKIITKDGKEKTVTIKHRLEYCYKPTMI